MLSNQDERKRNDYRFMMGPVRGNLAYLLDNLTDAMAMVAQHRVYCRVEKGPRAGAGSLDVEETLVLLQKCKDLVQQTMSELDESGPYTRSASGDNKG